MEHFTARDPRPRAPGAIQLDYSAMATVLRRGWDTFRVEGVCPGNTLSARGR